MKAFAEDIKTSYNENSPLDCFVNNAAVFENDGPKYHSIPSGEKLERTFMINVWAPYQLATAALVGLNTPLKRLLITSSISHSDCVF